MSIVSETHRVPELSEQIRIQDYGVGILNFCPTKSSLKKQLKKGNITVDRETATTATFLNGGELIELHVELVDSDKVESKINLEILYDDEYIAAVYKPPGIAVSGNSGSTIANNLLGNLTFSTLADACIPQPVHRLDYPTTGVLLVGKTASAIRELNRMFELHRVTKTYLAVTMGKMKTEGIIQTPLEGKEAITEWRALESVASERYEHLNLVQVKPKTGRTHQIRKHLASLGNSILGDKLYSPTDKVSKGNGLYLHAWKVSFRHPFQEMSMEFSSSVPKKFRRLFQNINI